MAENSHKQNEPLSWCSPEGQGGVLEQSDEHCPPEIMALFKEVEARIRDWREYQDKKNS